MEKARQEVKADPALEKYSRLINTVLKKSLEKENPSKHLLQLKRGTNGDQVQTAVKDASDKAGAYGLFTTSDHLPHRIKLVNSEIFIVAENISAVTNLLHHIERYQELTPAQTKDFTKLADKLKTAAIIEVKEEQMKVNSLNGLYGEAFFALFRESLESVELLDNNSF